MTSEQLCAYAGITYRQMDLWVRNGQLRVEAGGTKTGVPRQFALAEARVARAMGRLVAAGLSPAAAHRVARGEPLAPGITVTVDELVPA